ncbi:MAG: 2-oxoacid:acceptor oxidoreductase family protein [Desulfobacterales bacterium]|nr:MAG: 2-oxoacid:acceptor oxidoreductase family protein [Desulfobacterales bacterium]
MPQTDLTIAGVGGQGSILAGVILGSAAVTYDHKYATQTQAYSSELRGGFAATWVIISDEPIEFPRVTHPDILVAQAQDSITRFVDVLKPDGILIVDDDMVREIPDKIKRIFKVPATSIARNQMKAPVTANMVMLGALCQVTAVVSRQALESAIVQAVPKGKDRLNLEAFNWGFEKVQAP